MMQRSVGERSNHESAGCARRYSARSSRAFWASGVRGGSFPSGGSIINDVRPIDCPRSHQKLLYVPGSPARGGASWLRAVCSASSATSSSARTVLSPTALGFDKGVVVAYDHTPCKSGSPHAVLAIFQFFGAAFALTRAR